MADPISIAKEIISIGLKIKKVVDEVKLFKEYAERLHFKIEHLMPPLQIVADMESQRKALAAAEAREPEMKAFTKSLSEMQSIVKDIKEFIESLKVMSNIQKVMQKGKVKETYETYDYKLNVLRESINFGVLVEFKKEVDSGARQQDSVAILVKHVKKSAGQRPSLSPEKGKSGSAGKCFI